MSLGAHKKPPLKENKQIFPVQIAGVCFSSRYSALRGLHAPAVLLVLGGSGAGESDGALGKAPVCSLSPMEMIKVVPMGTGSMPYADVCQPTSRVSCHCAVLYNTWSTLSAASCIFNGGNLQRLRVCVRERRYGQPKPFTSLVRHL